MTAAKREKKQVGIHLDVEVIEYFKRIAREHGMPYASLINLTLRQSMKRGFTIEAINLPKETDER